MRIMTYHMTNQKYAVETETETEGERVTKQDRERERREGVRSNLGFFSH